MGFSDLIFKVAQVRCFKQGEEIGSGGSGFFYTEANRLYFITNRHVVISDKKSYSPDEIRLNLHINPNDITMFKTYCIPLYVVNRGGKPQQRWLENPAHDVVALPINEDTSQFIIKSFSVADHIPANTDIAIGEDILVIGYPFVFQDEKGGYELPIVRSGIIASIYPVRYGNEPKILIDASLHTGNSGSPVVTKATRVIQHTGGMSALNITVSLLVGVFSASAPFENKGTTHDEPLRLGIVWLASLIPEIISQSS